MKADKPGTLAGRIEGRILWIRGQRVMLSTHLADLYGVEPKVLVQAVKRNAFRFPEDFMLQLSPEEFNMKSLIVTSSWGGRRYPPYAFTEHGVAMLSSVLHSPQGRTSGAKMEKVEVVDSVPRFRS